MLDLVYRDLGLNMLRVWVGSGEDTSPAQMKKEFYANYVDNGMLREIANRGVSALLLAPKRGETKPTETMRDYAIRLAEFIRGIRDERSVVISVTGIANEPAGFTPAQLAEAARWLRIELDSRDLREVGIIGPEWASADKYLDAVVDAMKADAGTWAGLRGIASHSYNMGARPAAASRIIGTGKEYWQTEAGKHTLRRGNDEQPGNSAEAATVAARFLNDMNHMVTHWFWAIGVHIHDPHPFGDAGQELVRPDNRSGGLKISTKYYYLKQLLATFEKGAVFREAASSLEQGMVWTYGRKPAIVAAAAQNPDGTWAIGVTNTSGIVSMPISSYHSDATYRVTIRMPEAANGRFAVMRSNATLQIAREADVAMVDGEVAVVVRPQELVTIRSLR